MSRTSRPTVITPGKLRRRVLRAALRALDREEAAIDGPLRQRVDEALADPRPNRPAHDVFKRLRRHHAVSKDGMT